MKRDYTLRNQLALAIHQLSNVENTSITRIVLSEQGYQSLKKAAQNPTEFHRQGEFYMKPYFTDSNCVEPFQLYKNGIKVFPRYNYQI